MDKEEMIAFLREMRTLAKRYGILKLESPNIVVFSERNDGITVYCKLFDENASPQATQTHITIEKETFKEE